jgi:hypothetical protein
LVAECSLSPNPTLIVGSTVTPEFLPSRATSYSNGFEPERGIDLELRGSRMAASDQHS